MLGRFVPVFEVIHLIGASVHEMSALQTSVLDLQPPHLSREHLHLLCCLAALTATPKPAVSLRPLFGLATLFVLQFVAPHLSGVVAVTAARP